MSRRNRAVKRSVLADAKFKSVTVTQLINVVLERGKRSTAENVVYSSLAFLKEKLASKEAEVTLFKKALENIAPQLEVKSRRVGGANYQVPIEVPPQRGFALAMRWLVDAAQGRSEKDMAAKLGAELVQAFNNEGNAIRKKIETHKMAEANKAFAHFKF